MLPQSTNPQFHGQRLPNFDLCEYIGVIKCMELDADYSMEFVYSSKSGCMLHCDVRILDMVVRLIQA